ncbi:hypothetical protein JW710_02730 [Candidatus Dojkabacteria bacterium]|nr:hypothetical protein [Candidatus Dojkabacteria bacterium]
MSLDPVLKSPATNTTETEKKEQDKPKPRHLKSKKTGKALRNIFSLLVIITVLALGYRGYLWLDEKFKEQQKSINEKYSESVNLLLEESQQEEPFRPPHALEDKFPGWETYYYSTTSIRYPPEISPEYTLIYSIGCTQGITKVDFTSEEFRSAYYQTAPQGDSATQTAFYDSVFGMTLCELNNPNNLSIIDFASAPDTWFLNSSKYDAPTERGIIVRNWNRADLNRTRFMAYIYDGKLLNDNVVIVFIQDMDTKEIFIAELNLDYYNNRDSSKQKAIELFKKILTSIE